MTDDQQPDPIAEAFRTFTNRPKDVVPRSPRPEGDPPMPSGPARPYYDDQVDDEGMTHETGTAYIGPSIFSVEQLEEKRRRREERDT